MTSLISSIVLSAVFIVIIILISPYGSQHEPIEWLLWVYQNVKWDL